MPVFPQFPALGVLALAALGSVAFTPGASALDLKQRSVSLSKQFTVYCEDAAVRRQVTQFCDQVKNGVLQVLGESDQWRYPIIVTMQRASAAQPNRPPAALQVLQGELGFKVQIDVTIGADPAEVNLQKHLVRALYLEYSYRRNADRLEDGKPYVEPPWWLVEGTLQAFRMRDNGADADLFRRIIDVNRLPSLENLLEPRRVALGGQTAQAVDNACALCLLQLLLEQPQGRQTLGGYLYRLPQETGDPLTVLRKYFPTLGTTVSDLEKWWTLNLARLAATDRYKGLSIEETDSHLAALLQMEIPGDKGNPTKVFEVSDYAQFMKLEAAKRVVANQHDAILALSARANPLYVEIISDYEHIFALLMRGKTRGIGDRLAKVAASREFLLRRKSDIADYLNWFEATKMDVASRSFDGYLKVAKELATPARRNDPISRYLDEIDGGR